MFNQATKIVIGYVFYVKFKFVCLQIKMWSK